MTKIEVLVTPEEAMRETKEKFAQWRTRFLGIVEDTAKRCPDLTAEQLAAIRATLEESLEDISDEAAERLVRRLVER